LYPDGFRVKPVKGLSYLRMFSPSLASSVLKAKHNLAITARLAHWSVRGSDYYEAHLLFERIYKEAKADTDGLVEVMRGLGYTPTFEEFSGPGGSLPSFNRGPLVDTLLNGAMEYYARLVSFRNALKDEPRAVGLVNLLEDLTQTCNTIIYLLSASKGN
jgi:hypothetical protein